MERKTNFQRIQEQFAKFADDQAHDFHQLDPVAEEDWLKFKRQILNARTVQQVLTVVHDYMSLQQIVDDILMPVLGLTSNCYDLEWCS